MIPLFAPVRQNEPLIKELEGKFAKFLRDGVSKIDLFERELSQYLHVHHAFACKSAPDALILSLKALGLQAGDEVVIPAFCPSLVSSTVLFAGLIPVLADVDPITGCITSETVQTVLTPKTQAVVAVDLYGRQPDMEGLRKLCVRRALHLIEEGTTNGRRADISTSSFGNAVFTNDSGLAKKVRELGVELNMQLDPVQAIFFETKLPHLTRWTSKRISLANIYIQALTDLEARVLVRLPPPSDFHVWSHFTVRIPQRRDEVASYLRSNGVECGVFYPIKPSRSCPSAERLSQEALSLPFYPELSPKEVDQVLSQFRECLAN